MAILTRIYDDGTYDSYLWDGQDAAAPSSGSGFINTGADAASLWRKRREDIEALALQRRRPRVLIGVSK